MKKKTETTTRPFAWCIAIRLIQGDPHLLQWYRLKVLNVDGA